MVITSQGMIQAFQVKYGKINKGAGTYKSGIVIQCETAAAITLHFPQGDEAYTMASGAQIAYKGEFTVVSGTVSID